MEQLMQADTHVVSTIKGASPYQFGQQYKLFWSSLNGMIFTTFFLKAFGLFKLGAQNIMFASLIS